MITNSEIEIYCKTQTAPESALLQAVREYTQKNVSGAQMLSDVLVGRLLQLFVRQVQPRFALDLGTFTGYSALSVAEALPQGSTVLTCDKSKSSLEIAQTFFAKSAFRESIAVFEGEVSACINSILEPVDFAFIDADKMQLLAYVDLLYPKLAVGGMIIIDNVLWGGEVLNPEDKRAKAIHELNQTLANDVRFTNVLLPIRDGLNIMCKL